MACGNIGRPALDCLHESVDVLVLELSSYQLESTDSLKPLSAAVLNVSEDHMDRYNNIDYYASVKRRVYQHAKLRIANREDTRTWPDEYSENQNEGVCQFFSLAQAKSGSRTDFYPDLLDNINLVLPGEHNRANALAVIALASSLSVPKTATLKALQNFKGLAHRSEYVGEKAGIRWYNDSKGTNVDACKKAINAMPGPVILIAGGISKGADFSPLKPCVKDSVKLLILMGKDRDQLASQLSDCARIILTQSLGQSVSVASEHAVEGDVVLLSPACSSFDMFANFEDRGEQFIAAVSEVLAA